jgi:hypothetical protein
MSSLKTLEGLFGRYSDLSQEAIVKEELLAHGLSWERGLKVDEGRGLLRLEGGPYSLRRTIIRVNKQQDSPYRIESRGEHLKVVDREGGVLIALAYRFPQDSPYQSGMFADGTPYSAVVSPDAQVSPVGFDNEVHDPTRIADVVAEIFVKKQRPPREMPTCILIGGKSVLDSMGQQEEAEFFLKYVDAIRDRIGNQVPILLEMSPMPAEIEERIHRHGVEARLSNPGVWNQQLFAVMCPDENKKIGWEEWVRRLLDQVFVYGWNAALPRFAVGLEMAEPLGFKSSDEALASTSAGIRFFMMHGVVPNLIHWRAEPTSALAGQRQPSTEFFLEVDRIWYDAWVKYGQDEPIGYLMGPGRSRYPDSGVYDIGRGAPLKSGAKNSREKVQDARSAG